MVISIVKTVIQYNKKKYFLDTFFTSLVIGSILCITAVIHYGVIEFGYVNYVKLQEKHIVNTFKIDDDQDFMNSCHFQEYICYKNTNAQEIVANTKDEYFKKFLTQEKSFHNPNILILGRFSIMSPQRVYIIASYKNRWVIDDKTAKDFFAKSELVLMSLLSLAHGFWTIFYFWLVMFHQRRKLLQK